MEKHGIGSRRGSGERDCSDTYGNLYPVVTTHRILYGILPWNYFREYLGMTDPDFDWDAVMEIIVRGTVTLILIGVTGIVLGLCWMVWRGVLR